MSRVTVTLIHNDGAQKTQIEKDMLFQLISNISENGSEEVHTTQGSYKVTAIVIGDIKHKVILGA